MCICSFALRAVVIWLMALQISLICLLDGHEQTLQLPTSRASGPVAGRVARRCWHGGSTPVRLGQSIIADALPPPRSHFHRPSTLTSAVDSHSSTSTSLETNLKIKLATENISPTHSSKDMYSIVLRRERWRSEKKRFVLEFSFLSLACFQHLEALYLHLISVPAE